MLGSDVILKTLKTVKHKDIPQWCSNSDKLCIGNMPEKVCEQYVNFCEKLHNSCK